MDIKDFPETLYVCEEESRDGETWWTAEESPHNLADPGRPRRSVGIYRLVEMGEVVTNVAMDFQVEQSDQ